MPTFLATLTPMITMFLCIAIGYALRKTNILSQDSGKTVASGTPLELKNRYTADYITLYGVDEEQVKVLGLEYIVLKGAYRIALPNTAVATELIVKYPHIFKDYEITKGKMDDVFLNVTQKELAGEAKK